MPRLRPAVPTPRLVPGGRSLTRTRPECPTTPASPDPRQRSPATSWWSPQPSEAERSPTRPRTSSTLSTFVDERSHAGGPLAYARGFAGDHFFRRRTPRWPDHPFANESRESVIVAGLEALHGFESRDGSAAIDDEHW